MSAAGVAGGKRPADTIETAASVIGNAARSIGTDMDATQILSRVRLIRAHAADLEFAAVIIARQDGASWDTVGQMLGVTRQAAHKAYAHRLPRTLA